MIALLKSYAVKIGFVLAAVAIIYLEIQNKRLSAAQKAAEQLKDQAFAAQATSEGWSKAQLTSKDSIIEGINRENLDLGAQIERLRKSDPSVAPVSYATTTVTVADSAPGVVSVAGPACPQELKDEYGRFTVSVPQKPGDLPLFKRQQQFVFDIAVLKRLDGSAEFSRAELREYRPGLEPSPATLIPLTGVEASIKMEIAQQNAPKVSWFHPRAAFGVDHRGAIGAGAELVHLFDDRLELSALGLYYSRDKSADLAISGAYRLKFPLLNTNVSVGPLYYPLTRKIGLGLTVELTR